MFLGRVIGTVWSTVKWPELQGHKLLLVRPYSLADLARVGTDVDAAPNHDGVVCADVLGAGVGEDVVVAFGHAARVAISESLSAGEQPSIPIDAAVVAIVDRLSIMSGEGDNS